MWKQTLSLPPPLPFTPLQPAPSSSSPSSNLLLSSTLLVSWMWQRQPRPDILLTILQPSNTPSPTIQLYLPWTQQHKPLVSLACWCPDRHLWFLYLGGMEIWKSASLTVSNFHIRTHSPVVTTCTDVALVSSCFAWMSFEAKGHIEVRIASEWWLAWCIYPFGNSMLTITDLKLLGTSCICNMVSDAIVILKLFIVSAGYGRLGYCHANSVLIPGGLCEYSCTRHCWYHPEGWVEESVTWWVSSDAKVWFSPVLWGFLWTWNWTYSLVQENVWTLDWTIGSGPVQVRTCLNL